MKRSTKIFILALLWIPVSLVTYNLLLRKQYLAGNLKLEPSKLLRDNPESYVIFKLPKFKYVVVSGRVISGKSGAGVMTALASYPDIEIIGDSTKSPFAQVNKYYKSLYNTNLVNDTLYIHFYRERPIGN